MKIHFRGICRKIIDMLKRTITAVVALSLLTVVYIYSDTHVFPIVFGLLAVVGVYEMLGCVGTRRNFILSLCLYATAVFSTVLTQMIDRRSIFICSFSSFLFCILLILFAASVFSEGKLPIDKACISFTTCAYIITGFISIIMLRGMKNGFYICLIAFIAPWVTDTFAYFGGRLLGRHKLIPSVSPNKTIEGSICGMVFCSVACAVYGYIMSTIVEGLPKVWYFAILGFLVSIVSQVGDLIFSLIKRRYGIKDYGFVFPGHGGVLDRFDSIIATAPLILIVCEALMYFNAM